MYEKLNIQLVQPTNERTPLRTLLTNPVGEAREVRLTPTGRDAIQTLSSTGTSGTFTITYDGQTTSALDFDSTAAEIQTALEALSNITAGDVVVTGGPLPTNDIVITFKGDLRRQEITLLTTDDSSLVGGSTTVTETISGVAVAEILVGDTEGNDELTIQPNEIRPFEFDGCLDGLTLRGETIVAVEIYYD